MTASFPQWAGFERIPEGRLLRQLVDLGGNLLLPIALDDIARHAAASTSTLLRGFRCTTGQTPYAYEDLGAFSKAFRKQFRCAPSSAR